MTITTFDEAVQQCAADVPEVLGRRPLEEVLDEIEANLSLLRNRKSYGKGTYETWGLLAAAGISGALGEQADKHTFLKAMDSVVATVLGKQHDYGCDNITWGGVEGVILRSHDKLARIKNLLSRGDEAANEPLADSWLDITGYALIGMMLSRGTFGLPLASDVHHE